jgi:hypothetical protein
MNALVRGVRHRTTLVVNERHSAGFFQPFPALSEATSRSRIDVQSRKLPVSRRKSTAIQKKANVFRHFYWTRRGEVFMIRVKIGPK